MDFCRWLSHLLGYEVRLPTEQEWEKAARGTDGREYPWGDGYRSGYANINETRDKVGEYNLIQTTAVGIYPQGASPYGVLDLVGNVSEWCSSKYSKYRNPRDTDLGWDDGSVLRSGNRHSDRGDARAAFRVDPHWHIRDCLRVGFRVARCSPI